MARDITREQASRIIAYNNPVKLFLTGLLWGAAIGGVVGVLYAPKKGSETRQFIREKAQDTAKMIQYKAEDIRGKAAETRRRGEEELKSLKERA